MITIINFEFDDHGKYGTKFIFSIFDDELEIIREFRKSFMFNGVLQCKRTYREMIYGTHKTDVIDYNVKDVYKIIKTTFERSSEYWIMKLGYIDNKNKIKITLIYKPTLKVDALIQTGVIEFIV